MTLLSVCPSCGRDYAGDLARWVRHYPAEWTVDVCPHCGSTNEWTIAGKATGRTTPRPPRNVTVETAQTGETGGPRTPVGAPTRDTLTALAQYGRRRGLYSLDDATLAASCLTRHRTPAGMLACLLPRARRITGNDRHAWAALTITDDPAYLIASLHPTRGEAAHAARPAGEAYVAHLNLADHAVELHPAALPALIVTNLADVTPKDNHP